ncbi:2OG-Fe(II) oxygenase superfamily domain-containing protein [Penicillium digitatum]|uniref:Fe2OG dioxygenase domain-containing protein n=3 Tax=Penicillium digitatum TaxID=36651 RepID=K9FW11_PEND2|nr:hypothetical protein PDIP_46910 [Penicillium digitatum Pd1]EKV13329.1 hypothetical protein PDIG_38990 [Penicillium digitatum PHI26]EKV13799.1 hypothetical protein PDIP_46910 [Penicillium digitatum Pd1]KAG0152650.1 hypothetical protein PDIDSM_1130 [Penicillium digitatum]QQK40054.1 2OG-Fe(II) oxygenase superfamily domain-containing protein [Penicillium digitatum]
MSLSAVMTVSGPPLVVGPTSKRATRPTNRLPQYLIDAAKVDEKEQFDPKRHMSYEIPSKVYTMEEIGLAGQGISPIAVTAPFQLFTKEAIMQMRAEIFSDPVLRDCQYMSDFVKNTIRGMGPARAPFTCDAWRSPEVLSAISEVAGIDLIPAMDCEIAAINISINDQAVGIVKSDDSLPAFAWHRDSYPFVCVTILSDCTGMTGGETALKTASGDIMKVRGPAMGTAVVMQGRYIEHQALKAFGGRERISMVTSFRAKSPHIRDETVLTGVRPICNLSELYTQYTEYRLEILEERIRIKLQQERQREKANRTFEIVEMRNFLTEQVQFLEAMTKELIE